MLHFLRAVLLPEPPDCERQAILEALLSVAETTGTATEEVRLLLRQKEALAEVLLTGRLRAAAGEGDL